MTGLHPHAAMPSARRAGTGKAVVGVGAVAVVCLCCARCGASGESGGAGSGHPRDLRVTVQPGDGVRTLALSRSLCDVASGLTRADSLQPDLDLGGTPGAEFGYVADAAVMGTFAAVMLAGLVPAVRATRASPMGALRTE